MEENHNSISLKRIKFETEFKELFGKYNFRDLNEINLKFLISGFDTLLEKYSFLGVFYTARFIEDTHEVDEYGHTITMPRIRYVFYPISVATICMFTYFKEIIPGYKHISFELIEEPKPIEEN